MTGLERREKILELLSSETEPLSASNIAKVLGVSRQIIVGDVALIRAQGIDIMASPRGYILINPNDKKIQHNVVCIHTTEQTAEELNIFVDCGLKVENVIVEHPVYGQLIGQLEISSRIDVEEFLKRCQEENAHSLCELTDGIHIHTVECPSEEAYNRAIQMLKAKGMILDDNT